ncbi:PPE family protein [Mycobacterium haemophilum]|uniref:PPE family protein n=1 Tax=Mycobacterium haemophilum TaxID=29311 RepID=UPI000A5B4F43|nr:PPE family protein [Mycobacterium haemophilum]
MPNFNALPPEINVSNIKGPGSKPILIAAAAWESLEQDLASAAKEWGPQIAQAYEAFQGEAANKFSEAAVRYHEWLHKHALTAKCTAEYLIQAADAYEEAVRSMVPTAPIVKNRAAAWTMKSTNLLGQFTHKIMELDDEYHEMWATNAGVMNEYQFRIFDIMRQVEETGITPAPLVIHGSSKAFSGSHYSNIIEEL